MKAFLKISALSSLAAMFLLAAPEATQAQARIDRTKLKFSTPVMVPGATLPPGTYTFEMAGTVVTRNLIEIRNEEGTKLIATAMAVPATRIDPKGATTVTIQRTDPEAAPALKRWFYPGDLRGHEFIYPQKQARALADETKTLVLSSDAPEGSDLDTMAKARLWYMGPEGERKEYKEKPGT